MNSYQSNRETKTQLLVDRFYKENGPCCAGCDWWRFINSAAGECIKNAPVSDSERLAMLGISKTTLPAGSGHIMTKRDHVCGDFLDTYDWNGGQK